MYFVPTWSILAGLVPCVALTIQVPPTIITNEQHINKTGYHLRYSYPGIVLHNQTTSYIRTGSIFQSKFIKKKKGSGYAGLIQGHSSFSKYLHLL